MTNTTSRHEVWLKLIKKITIYIMIEVRSIIKTTHIIINITISLYIIGIEGENKYTRLLIDSN